MNELNRFQLAAVKRTAQTVKSLRRQLAKKQEEIQKAAKDILDITALIETWETPIKQLTGGLTSEEVLKSLTVSQIEGELPTSNREVEEVQEEEGPYEEEDSSRKSLFPQSSR